MDRANNSRKRLAQYIRVSSEEQAKRGFSIPDQKRELDLWAESKGFQIVATEIDDGYESWVMERPGLDRIRDLVEAGLVNAVVVWKRNRLSRESAHMWLLQQEFKDKGVELICLDSSADESPEGQLMAGMLDQLSKYELLAIRERTRRGSLQKARSGKVILSSRPNYGFKPNATRDGYLVDEITDPIVRRIFDMVGVQGKSVHTVVNTLNAEGIPSPTGKKWTRPVIRAMVQDDVYKGVWYYNRRKVKRSRETGTYRRKTKTTYKL
jgi:site-specific DNA recombinase